MTIDIFINPTKSLSALKIEIILFFVASPKAVKINMLVQSNVGLARWYHRLVSKSVLQFSLTEWFHRQFCKKIKKAYSDHRRLTTLAYLKHFCGFIGWFYRVAFL